MRSLLGLLLVTASLSLSPSASDHSDQGSKEETQEDAADAVSPAHSLVWGPGLETHFVVPVRYFFIQLKDEQKRNITQSVGENPFQIIITHGAEGRTRVHIQQLDRHDGSYIVRYKLYQALHDVKIAVTYRGVHVGSSPYIMKGNVYQEGCYCPVPKLDKWLKAMKCPASYSQIERDLAPFPDIHMSSVVPQVMQRFNQSGSRSLCRYIIKDNKLYRSTMGKHVGFKMFSDAMLLSLLRKVKLPDMEFYVNLGDWPLETRSPSEGPLPILSWCGSDDTRDIVMPTYDLTESTLETMGRCENTTSNSLAMPTYEMDEEQLSGSCRTTLDLLSVQGNTPIPWKHRLDTGFWRGRDSRRERLELVKMSRRDPKVIDAKLTNMFFFKHEKEELGELVKHISFFDFFKYKYQVNIDGTVAAYRFPYLLAGGSVTLKHNSKYYEHFYKDLESYVHYVPYKDDLSDLQEQLQWARANDDKAKQIAANARQFVLDHLLAKDIYCYHILLFKNYASRLRDVSEVLPDMEHVPQPADKFDTKCTCVRGSQKSKDEL